MTEGEESSVRAVLGGGTSVEGRVIDDLGRPVRGAEVKLWQRRVEVRAVTDPDGRFVVRGLDEGEIRVEARFGHLASARYQNADTRDAIEIVIHRTAQLSGNVRDRSTGETLTDFRVYLVTRPHRSSGGGTHFKNPLGRFVLDDLDPGSHLLRVLAPGYVFRETPVALSPGERRELDVELTRGASVSGRLVDRSGEVVAGARIFPVSPEEIGKPIRRMGGLVGGRNMEGLPYHQTFQHAWAEEARSDDEGRFTLGGRAPGPIQLRVEYGHDLFEDLPAFAVPAQGEARLGDVQLQRGSTVQGLLLDESGVKIRGGSLVICRVREDGVEETGSTVYCQIGKDGLFKETGLRSGRYRVRLWENKTFNEFIELGVGETRIVEFQLPPGK